jgi:hypothetical protein
MLLSEPHDQSPSMTWTLKYEVLSVWVSTASLPNQTKWNKIKFHLRGKTKIEEQVKGPGLGP